MPIRKILWPTDFSGSAQYAMSYVRSLTEKYGAEVHVLYVIPELGLHEPWYGEFDRSHIDKIHEWERNTAEKRLDEICDTYLKGCRLYVKQRRRNVCKRYAATIFPTARFTFAMSR